MSAMSAFLASANLNGKLHNLKTSMPEWWPILFGLLILYVPTFYDIFASSWVFGEQTHQPIIMALSIWLIVRSRRSLLNQSATNLSVVIGWFAIVVALSFYIIGRSQQIPLIELSSIIWLSIGIILIKFGSGALKTMWFPIAFMLFMIPWPGTIIIALTLPMKMAVSYVSEQILYWADYPIARNGVTLQIGQYQLLVADACAGMQTLLTLESLGLFYLNFVRRTSAFRNIALAILIVPISFIANVIRVITLILITYYYGDAAGQGFLHGFAGIVLFLSALLIILAVDNLLQYVVKNPRVSSKVGS